MENFFDCLCSSTWLQYIIMAGDLKKRIKDVPKKSREFGVILENIDSNVKHIVEVVDTHTEQLKRLEGVPDKLEKIESRLDVIETTLESVNLPMWKQKFIALEKRVSTLESKQQRMSMA